MELLKDILARLCITNSRDMMACDFDANQLCGLVEGASFQALQKIKAVLEDDSLDDFFCVEEIICIFEDYLGSGCGSRHDF